MMPNSPSCGLLLYSFLLNFVDIKFCTVLNRAKTDTKPIHNGREPVWGGEGGRSVEKEEGKGWVRGVGVEASWGGTAELTSRDDVHERDHNVNTRLSRSCKSICRDVKRYPIKAGELSRQGMLFWADQVDFVKCNNERRRPNWIFLFNLNLLWTSTSTRREDVRSKPQARERSNSPWYQIQG